LVEAQSSDEVDYSFVPTQHILGGFQRCIADLLGREQFTTEVVDGLFVLLHRRRPLADLHGVDDLSTQSSVQRGSMMHVPGVLCRPRPGADENGKLVQLRWNGGVEASVGDGPLCEIAQHRAHHHDPQRSVDSAARTAQNAVHEGFLLGRQLIVRARPPDAIAPKVCHGLPRLFERGGRGRLRVCDDETEQEPDEAREKAESIQPHVILLAGSSRSPAEFRI
jgi:hypothetical protein